MVTESYQPLAGKSLDEILLELAGYEDQAFSALLEAVRSTDGFKRTYSRCKALAARIGAEKISDVFFLLSAIGFFYSEIQGFRSEGDETLDLVRLALDPLIDSDESSEKREIIIHRLASLVEPNTAVDDHKKLERLQTDLVRNGTGFSSFIDLRPDYTNDKSRIRGLVPVILFRVSTDSRVRNEQSFVFQLTEEALGKLGEAV